jgi:hypothetical protein
MGRGPHHRGAIGNIPLFADRFITARIAGFEKDMGICLTPTSVPGRRAKTHAYFPALALCCGTLEYMAGLNRGRTNGLGWPDVANWAEHYMPQPDYDRDTIRVLVSAFRNSVAHRGIASGVWVDPRPPTSVSRRTTWKILADAKRPACRLAPEAGTLTKDPPWPSPYTHRAHIHLKALQIDIREAAHRFCVAISNSVRLQRNFEACMNELYPR